MASKGCLTIQHLELGTALDWIGGKESGGEKMKSFFCMALECVLHIAHTLCTGDVVKVRVMDFTNDFFHSIIF